MLSDPLENPLEKSNHPEVDIQELLKSQIKYLFMIAHVQDGGEYHDFTLCGAGSSVSYLLNATHVMSDILRLGFPATRNRD